MKRLENDAVKIVQAVTCVIEEHPDVAFVFTGGGDFGEEVENFAGHYMSKSNPVLWAAFLKISCTSRVQQDHMLVRGI